MPKIYVKKAFTLNAGAEQQHFAVGNHTVSADVADHWFVKAHVGEPEPASESERAADELLADLDKREKALAAREKAAEQAAAEAATAAKATPATKK